MLKLLRNSMIVLFILALPVMGVTASSLGPALQAQGPTQTPSELLCGQLAELPGVAERLDAIAAFQPDLVAVEDANLSVYDRLFIEEGILANTLELESLQIASERVQNEELACLIDMMIVMHNMDLQALMAISNQLGMTVPMDLTAAPVYPYTPTYDLGVRTINLEEKFLQPLEMDLEVDRYEAHALHILMEEHGMDVEVALTAIRLVENEEVRAMARHTADTAKLHLILMDNLTNRLFFNYSVPPMFDAPYMDPRSTETVPTVVPTLPPAAGEGTGTPVPTVLPTFVDLTEFPTISPTLPPTEIQPTAAPTQLEPTFVQPTVLP